MDKDWVNIGTQNFLRFSQLPVGTYELVVKGKNTNDQESINQISLVLHVEQVFYKKAWFLLLATVLFLSLIYFLLPDEDQATLQDAATAHKNCQ